MSQVEVIYLIMRRIRIVIKNSDRGYSITCSKIRAVLNNFRIKYKTKKICMEEFHRKVKTSTRSLEDHQQDSVEDSPLLEILAQRINVSEK